MLFQQRCFPIFGLRTSQTPGLSRALRKSRSEVEKSWGLSCRQTGKGFPGVGNKYPPEETGEGLDIATRI
jgi:hypothetical protein